MAKGITEMQVHAAADALVAAGERPTVERVRAALGTGSPNTVTRLLETWWAQLGTRLAAQTLKMAIPDAPAAVVTLASQLWEQALATAQAQATETLDADRLALAAEREALEDMREAFCEKLEAETVARLDAERDRVAALTRVEDLQRFLEQQSMQLQELGTQRDQLRHDIDTAQALVSELQVQLHERDATLIRDRADQAAHLRGVEDRAHAEVDRARQELKALLAQLTQQTQAAAAATQARDRALRAAAAQSARADALTEQLAQLAHLPAQLQAWGASLHSHVDTAPRRNLAGSKRPRVTKKTVAGAPSKATASSRKRKRDV